jgi:hypothetical protein
MRKIPGLYGNKLPEIDNPQRVDQLFQIYHDEEKMIQEEWKKENDLLEENVLQLKKEYDLLESGKNKRYPSHIRQLEKTLNDNRSMRNESYLKFYQSRKNQMIDQHKNNYISILNRAPIIAYVPSSPQTNKQTIN